MSIPEDSPEPEHVDDRCERSVHMNPPRVSVVIPSARGGPYLRESVGSVLAQSFADFEVIVVADGCPDDLDDLEALDGRIRVVRQANRGVSVARNVGVRASRSDLIAFLDDDDRMLPGRLQAQHDLVRRRPEVALCHTQFRVIDDRGVACAPGHARDVQYLDLLRGEVHVLLPTMMMRKAFLDEVGLFDPILRTGQDLDLIYRVARESSLAFLPHVLTEYRRHGSNASGDAQQDASVLTALLHKHRRLALQLGRDEDVGAAEQGIKWASTYGATGAMLAARASWRRRNLPQTMRSIATAVRLAPGQSVRDLVGGRRLVRRILPPGSSASGRTRQP